ncbi:carbohydrate ABC transporter permease [Phaeacidiphilus oryzae]|uniref:carbohydrate ABC transporter permease n=1 Tax=Phaeacidiphilus oryzae TaxID=348818 RepID=UPI00055B6EEA|nr:sugar ABC transporter permease [Phaeacidiphilus oryzae]
MAADALSATRPPASRPASPLRRLRRALDRHWYGWAMVLPVVIVMAVLVLYPLGKGIYYSLTDANESNVARHIGMNHIPATYHMVWFKNYADILSDGYFWGRLVWTVVWTVCCVTLQVSLGMALAVMLNRRVRGRAVYRALLIVPWAVPAFVSVFAWRLMLNSQYGVFNSVLTHLGLPAQDWLGSPTAMKVAVVIVNVWIGIPFNMVAMLGGLQAIPRELYEAAEMDGASPWQRFTGVTLPGLRPVTATVVMLGTIWTFNQFPVIWLMLGQTTDDSADILVTAAYRLIGSGVSDYAGAAAYGVLILAVLLAFSTYYRKQINRGEAVS